MTNFLWRAQSILLHSAKIMNSLSRASKTIIKCFIKLYMIMIGRLIIAWRNVIWRCRLINWIILNQLTTSRSFWDQSFTMTTFKLGRDGKCPLIDLIRQQWNHNRLKTDLWHNFKRDTYFIWLKWNHSRNKRFQDLVIFKSSK